MCYVCNAQDYTIHANNMFETFPRYNCGDLKYLLFHDENNFKLL